MFTEQPNIREILKQNAYHVDMLSQNEEEVKKIIKEKCIQIFDDHVGYFFRIQFFDKELCDAVVKNMVKWHEKNVDVAVSFYYENIVVAQMRATYMSFEKIECNTIEIFARSPDSLDLIKALTQKRRKTAINIPEAFIKGTHSYFLKIQYC